MRCHARTPFAPANRRQTGPEVSKGSEELHGKVLIVQSSNFALRFLRDLL
jgi:hypothetical protein